MAKESSVAPKERINITFKPATGGAQEEIELPLKLLVVGDYIHRFDDRKLEDRKPIAIDKMTFDEVLSKQGLALSMSVPNRLQSEGDADELAIALGTQQIMGQAYIPAIKDGDKRILMRRNPWDGIMSHEVAI